MPTKKDQVPAKFDKKDLVPIQDDSQAVPAKFDKKDLVPIGQEDTRNDLQKGFDKLTAPVPFTGFHDLQNNPISETFSNLGAGTIGLLSPLFHPIQTLKTMRDVGMAASGNPALSFPAQQRLVAPFVPQPNESGSDYAARMGGTATTMIPGLLAPEAGPEAGELAAAAVKPVVNTVGKAAKVLLNPKTITGVTMAGTALANPHLSSVLPLVAEGAGGFLLNKYGSKLFRGPEAVAPDMSWANRWAKMGEPWPDWANPGEPINPNTVGGQQYRAALKQYQDARGNIIQKNAFKATPDLTTKLNDWDNRWIEGTLNDPDLLRMYQERAETGGTLLPKLAPLTPLVNQQGNQ